MTRVPAGSDSKISLIRSKYVRVSCGAQKRQSCKIATCIVNLTKLNSPMVF